MEFLTRRCVECGHEVEQQTGDTAPTFCTCESYGPQMVPPPFDEGRAEP